ncbi:unnamed protein product [Oreochromis niloticus]|nr:unnamed protein product [Mustela putorius furo]
MLHGLPPSDDAPGPRQRAVMPAMPAKVPKYNGLTPLEPYLSQVRLAARHNGWSDEEAATHLALALEGDALQVAEEKIREMAAVGVIEPSNSPWAAPMVLVGKKDGSPRFCVDFHRLNAVTKKCWFSSLDLRSGYWQVELAPEARPKTAFTIGQGLWQFRVMPFGLCNAPATFERLMERVLVNIPHSRCVVYLDDLLVHGGDFDSALSHLSEVFSAIRRAGLRLNPAKCRLLARETTFLGHVISAQGITTDSAKVAAVRDWPTPSNVKQLRSFLGLASYYRRFIKGFATIASPLHRLTDKGQPFGWSDACAAAFAQLKEALTRAPVLAYPDARQPFIVDTDASNVGVGAVLSQQGEAGEQQLKREQEADATLGQVGAWLEAAQRPDWTGVSGQEPEVKAYYSQHNNLETHDGLLYWRWWAPGNRYVLVAMDYFTKWPEAYAVPDQSATTTAERLVEEMFARFGVLAELHSDQGRNFESKVFGEICRRLGVEKTRTTPLHPQSDGLVERFNRTLATQLAILTSRHQRDWDRHLPLVLWSYRTAVQESSQCTPAALMFGRELRTPVDLVFGSPPEPEIDGGPEMDYYRRLRERLQVVHDYTRRAQASAGVRQKRAYDTRCRGEAFVPGDKVWVYCPVRKRGVSPKLCSHWQGPAEVVERLTEVVYRIRMPGPGRMVVLHRDRLSPYRPLAPADAGAGDADDTPGSDLSDFSPAGRDRLVRQKKALGHLQDFVWGNGAVGDD